MPLKPEHRTVLLETVKGQQFASLAERGFVPAEEGGDTLSAAEEAQVRSLAERNGLAYEEVKAQFFGVGKRRS